MSGILKTYDLSAVKLAIGGILLGGYAEGGGIEVAPAAPVGEFSSGADGEAVFSRSNNDAVFVTVTVMETSAGYRHLAQLAATQKAAVGRIPPLPFSFSDPINGTYITGAYCAFMEHTTVSKGATAGERVFRLVVPGVLKTWQLGILNLT